eukprot:TRINITY_DN48525_c0_g1_i1.p1 TRINITY_DN48525_c0_g1~~TRINITY_DN48525_c0_g1_i1.p1  ORF type:complete len:604 (+),score=81.37 TRINITY_DN48525_c0_g1_i1:76-1812(+)
MEVDPPDDKRNASSSFNNDALGTGHHRGRLDSPQAWSAARNEGVGEWYEMDAEGEVYIAGVVTKGRQDHHQQWVTGFRVEVSGDRCAWEEVDRGVIFPGNTDQHTPVYATFRRPVRARYVRLFPMSANGHMSMRCGLLVQDRARMRQSCFYGESCRNTKEFHRTRYAHPGDSDFEAVKIVVGNQPVASVAASKLFDLIDVQKGEMLGRHEIAQVEVVMADRVKACFGKFDQDGNGLISKMEMVHVFSRLGLPEDSVEEMFAEADANRDGAVDYNEFIQWIFSDSVPRNLQRDIDFAPFPSFEELNLSGTGQVGQKEWTQKMQELYDTMGKNEFIEWAEKQTRMLQRALTQRGARIFARGLPRPNDDLQRHALEFVSSMWGEKAIHRKFCQEYGIRTHARLMHVSGAHEYTPPSTGFLQTFHGGKVIVERVVKIAIRNETADLTSWAIAYHGVDTHAKDGWARSGPVFTGYGGAHGDGIYTTPAFSLAGAYALRRWTGEWRYDDVPSEYCSDHKMHFIAILMCALKDFKKCVNTADRVAATTEGWGREVTEWVIPGRSGQPVPNAQIYGVLFCYFQTIT